MPARIAMQVLPRARFTLPIAVAALVTAIALGTGVARASWDWCWEDPIISVDGKTVNIEVGIPAVNLQDIRGPVRVLIYVPRGVDARIVAVTNNLFTEDVQLVRTARDWRSGEATQIDVWVRADSTEAAFPVMVRVSYSTPEGPAVLSWTGQSGDWIQASFRLP